MKEKKILFDKYCALGNDYIIIDPNKNDFEVESEIIKNICNRNFGIGADGILVGPIFQNANKENITNKENSTNKANIVKEKTEKKIAIERIKSNIPFVRIFNSDGSEAEKSGNGLRIFSQYLLDSGYLRKIGKIKDKKKFVEIRTTGGIVQSFYNSDGTISIEMGKVEFFTEEDKQIVAFAQENNKEKVKFNGIYLSIGNPHFVIIMDKIDEQIAKKYGKSIETNPYFKNKTNVQFVQIIDRKKIKIEIFERGSGYTLASGSSSCAAAAVAYKKGFIDSEVEVLMQGGSLKVYIGEDFNITQTGKAKFIFSGKFFISTFLDKFQN